MLVTGHGKEDPVFSALVLTLTPLAPLAQKATGWQALRWFKAWLDQRDPALFARLQESNHYRAYTVAVIPAQGRYPAWLRVTSVDPDLSALLADDPPARPGDEITLDPAGGRVRFTVDDVLAGDSQRPPFAAPDADPQGPASWAGGTNFAALVATLMQPVENPPLSVRLHFHTCTSFRLNTGGSVRANLPLPVPHHVLKSILAQWEGLSPAPLPVLVGEFIDRYVWVRYHRIRTEMAISGAGERGKTVGFAGLVQFNMAGRGQVPREMRRDWRHYVDVVRLLAAFSFYCGTGSGTTHGLGMTLPLDPVYTPR